MTLVTAPSRVVAEQGRTRYWASVRRAMSSVGLLVVLLIIDVALQPALLSVFEIGFALKIALAVILVATAQTLVVLTGGLDLSVGGMVSVGNALTATLVTQTALGGLGVPVVLMVGALMGALNGVLVAYLNYQPVVATLATWSVFGGLALLILPTAGGSVDESVTGIFNANPAGVSVAFVWLALILLAWFGFRRTGVALQLYAVGGDPVRSALNRIPVRRVALLAYAASGVAAASAGFYIAATTYGGDPVVGNGYLLPSIAAVVVGGTSLRGGVGGVGRTVVGALALFVLSDIITAMDFSPNVAITASSLLLLTVVAVRAIAARVRS